MSYLDPVALAALRQRRTTARIGQDLPWWNEPLVQFIGPDTARQRVGEVDGLFAVLDLEITRSTTVSQKFKDLWAKHCQSWKDFKKSVDDMGTVAMLVQALSVNERAGHFARGLKEWRSAFEREGGKPVAAAPNEQRKESSSGIPWQTVVIVLAGAAGLFALGYTVRSFRGPSAATEPESSL